MSGQPETASGSKAAPAAPNKSEVSDRSRAASALLAKITGDSQGASLSDSKVTEFFRNELWGAGKPPGAFEETVMDKAVDLVAPSSSTAHPKPSGVNAVEESSPKSGPVTPKRSPRLLQQATTPSPVRKPSKSQKPAAEEGKKKTPPSPKVAARATKSPSPQPLPPILKKTGHKPASQSKAAKTVKGTKSPKQTNKKDKKDSLSVVPTSGLRQSNKRTLAALRASALTQVPAEAFKALDSTAKRPKRCRMPPLQSWRNERLVFERVAGSMTPSLAAVELNMCPPMEESSRPRHLQLPALQPPLESMQASEFVGISTEIFTSKLFALPPRDGAPCTVVLSGVGIIHVLDGSLRFAKEGEEREEIVPAGGTRLVKDAGPKLLAPAGHFMGARFRWLECKHAA